MQVKKQYLEPDMEQQTDSRLKNEYINAVYCHHAYLTYAVYIIWNAGLNETQAEIKIAGRNINNFRYADDTILIVESEDELKNLLMRVKEESKKAGLKQHSKNEDHGLWSHHFKAYRDGETKETVDRLFSWTTISLWMVTAALDLTNACSLEEKQLQT